MRIPNLVAVAVMVTSACTAQPTSTSELVATTEGQQVTSTTTSTTTLSPASTQGRPRALILGIDAVTADRMSLSWRPGCPVSVHELRLVLVPHVGFGGETRIGELVIHAAYAEDIAKVFETLYQANYPIERMLLVDEFGASDVESMNANNTSAYNCREVAGQPGVWSEHAFGRAIDINPIQNPYIGSDGSIAPGAGAEYVERDTTVPGLITAGDVVVRAFSEIGWSWGGDWSNVKDYQHFSATGR